MACKECEYKGFVETFIGMNSAWRPIIKPCKVCNDISAYSRRVQELAGFVPDEPPPPPKSAA